MPISKKIAEDMKRGSWIRRMFEEGIRLKKEFGAANVFDLSLGNPEIEPPKNFTDTLKELVNHPFKGMHRYMPNSGYPETRAAVAKTINKESKVKFGEADVIMSCGAGGGLNVVLKSVLNAGDEAVIFAPYFVEYGYYLDNHGAKCVVAETDAGFLPDINELDKKIGYKTRAVIVNSPNNPTGVVYDAAVFKKMAELLAAKNKKYNSQIFLIMDDAYGKLVYDGAKPPCLFNYYPHTIIAASFSKTLSIPGERIGYIAVNPECPNHDEIMAALAFCNRILGFVNAPALMQHAIAKTPGALVDVSIYEKKRDFLYGELKSAGYDLIKPKGAFYLFPKTPIQDDIAFTKKLLEHRVLAVPGTGFGRSGYMRLSYCVEDSVLEGAVRGLRKAFR
ncbi:MAG: pyridoxal phosphate-dependent aminotransferase [Deltaproteobacteria bacterium]|nr:pyridoxal phosphate-dependent aminotransferase [Deltaproteobacteria bacterium]